MCAARAPERRRRLVEQAGKLEAPKNFDAQLKNWRARARRRRHTTQLLLTPQPS
jgi:hypothetical protein